MLKHLAPPLGVCTGLGGRSAWDHNAAVALICGITALVLLVAGLLFEMKMEED